MPTQKPTAMDDAALAAFLSTHHGQPVSRLSPLKGGAWSHAHSYSVGPDRFVVRMSNWGDDFLRDERASIMLGDAIPVPEVIGIDAEADPAWCITRWLPGKPTDVLTLAEWEQLLPSLFSIWDALASVDVSHSAGYGGWDGRSDSAPFATQCDWLLSATVDDPTDPRNGGWRPALRAIPGATEEFELVARAFKSLVDDLPNRRQVAHCDMLNYNMVAENGVVTGLFDWGCAQYCDHLYDVAMFALYGPYYPALFPLLLSEQYRQHRAELGRDTEQFEQRVLAYALHIALGNMKYNARLGHIENYRITADLALDLVRKSV